MKSVMKVRDVSSAKSETKLKRQSWILCMGTSGSADCPRYIFFSILGEKRGWTGHVTHLQSTVGYTNVLHLTI